MTVPGSANPLLLRSAAPTAYQVSRSLRFSSGDSSYLSRTPASAGNRKTWTWSGWVKRSALSSSAQYALFSTNGTSDSTFSYITFFNDTIAVTAYTLNYLVTSAVYRDASAWMHIVVALDTTQATASNRLKLYVNGSEVTAFSTDNRSSISQNSDLGINSAISHAIGRQDISGVNYFSGYLAEIHFIDGTALTPSSFAETDATTGQWVPKLFSGSYGSQGWKLTFADNSNNTASTLGADSSGNGNHWSPTNLQVVSGGPTSVASASGALPIYNTTDTYGTTKGTGTRTDSNSSSIVLALPMDGANNGTTFTDESATIKGSGSAKSITRNGDTKTSTAQSKFYGSSGYFDGSGDYLTVPLSTDFQISSSNFTVELWFNADTVSGGKLLAGCGNILYSASTGWNLFLVDNILYARTSPSSSSDIAKSGIIANKWYHVAYVRSGTTHTLYVDGISAGSTTVASVTDSSSGLNIGYDTVNSIYPYQGYIQDLRVYKGVAKYTSNFNPPSSTQNPSIAPGNDSLTDSPTSYGSGTSGGDVRGNFCTFNPLNLGSGVSLANGNLDVTLSGSNVGALGTMAMPTGKWYFEGTVGGTGSNVWIAIRNAANTQGYFYSTTGLKTDFSGAAAYGASSTTGDVLGVAFDNTAGTITFYKNGVSQGVAYSGISSTDTWFPYWYSNVSVSTAWSFNFGQRAFAYTPPANFKPLVDTYLPTPTVAKPSEVFQTVLWDGDGTSTRTITVGFEPDLIWEKVRNNAQSHLWYDAVRGFGSDKAIGSNSTIAEGGFGDNSGSGYVSGTTSTGFSIVKGSSGAGYMNSSGYTQVAWCWDAGSSTVTNTQGSISSQVRANASAGFSIVSFTGNATFNATVGHGLGVVPKMIIIKNRSSAQNWVVYTTLVDGTNDYLFLNLTDAKGDATATAPTSNVFYLSSAADANGNGNSIVAYCFAPVAGYSSFGSYTGNGSTDGPFVFTGHRSRFLLIKRTDGSANYWSIIDTARSASNVANAVLYPNASDAESTVNFSVDVLSNGFKLRSTSSDVNVSNGTYLFASFAENPFQYARAR